MGEDCDHNEYWAFIHDTERVYIKRDGNQWWYYDESWEIQQLKEACNPKGVRERELLDSIERVQTLLNLKENY